MAGLDGQDGTGNGEVSWLRDELGSTEVGADSDTLENLGGLQEGLNTGQAEVVGALLDCNMISDYRLSFDEQEDLPGVAPAALRAEVKVETWVASSAPCATMLKRRRGLALTASKAAWSYIARPCYNDDRSAAWFINQTQLMSTNPVEGGLEVLKGQRIVEDVGVRWTRLTLLKGSSGGDSGQEGDLGGEGLHFRLC